MVKPTRWMIQLVLWFVIMLNMWGCASKEKDNASWISVVKPPIQIVYVSRDKEIEPTLVHSLVTQVTGVPYKDYQFNENINVSLNTNTSRVESDTEVDSTSVAVSTD